MAAGSLEFARAIASVIAPALPSTVKIEVDGTAINVLAKGIQLHASGAAAILESPVDDENRRVQIERLARTILNGVQDAVMEATRSPWPIDRRGILMLPASALENTTLRLWFETPDAEHRVTLGGVAVVGWLA